MRWNKKAKKKLNIAECRLFRSVTNTEVKFLKFQEGETVLISAARDGHLEVVRTLLSKYADIEAADSVS